MIHQLYAVTSLTIAVLGQVADPRIERLRGLQARFQQPEPQIFRGIAVSILAIVAIFVIVKVLGSCSISLGGRVAGTALPPSTHARATGDADLDRWCLWRLAKALSLAHPTALLISPVYFDEL